MNIICFFKGHKKGTSSCPRCGVHFGIPDFSEIIIPPTPSRIEKSNFESAKSTLNYNYEGTYFEVPGAGYMRLSDTPHYVTGSAAGFDIGVSWGKHGYIGGILGRREAIRMAKFILEKCDGVTISEEDEVEQSWERLKKSLQNSTK